ncbi:thiol-disulfide oxidoreductase DCC family protein [Bacillus sp. JJ1474]|uniref:thiol-disulfide oxidoreductase DCC family protein n=1 Tax=Bacillus sp. JJ1474 TaxID=3122955 RepID=UPI002FFF7B19
MKTIALYDETCSLCKESKQFFEKIDRFHKVSWVSLQEYEKTRHSIPFDKISLRRELHIISSGGKVRKGYDAIRYLLLLTPPLNLLGLCLYFPAMSFVGNPLYKWVAKNRHKFFRKKCDNGSCSL